MSLIRPAACIALASLLIVGCGSDGSTGPGSNSTMSANIAGAAWSGTLATQGVYTSNLLSVSGSNGTYQIAINIPNLTATGTYQLGAGNFGVAQVIHVTGNMAAWTTSLVGGTGTVTVSTLSADRAVGTFSFTGMASPGTPATGSRAVTNGSFDVRY